jgi:hypothetical protein
MMKGKTATFSFTVTRDNDEEIDLSVTGKYYPSTRGARDGRWGPPIEPDEPAEFEIESVTRHGVEFELTEEEHRQAEEQGMEEIENQQQADYGIDDLPDDEFSHNDFCDGEFL